MNTMEDTHSSTEMETKASVRKKRKLPNSPSSLVGSTIQEYGVFTKDVDELSSQVHRMFDFLEPWQRNADRMDKAILNSVSGKSSYSEADDASLASSVPEREPTLEEELHLRLGRMTSIAKTLRFLCNKEREQRASLFAEVQECKARCVRLVQDLGLQHKQQEKVMQQRLSEMERNTETLEQEKTGLQQTCHDIATQAKKTILSLEKDLTSSKDTINKQHKSLKELSKSNEAVAEECKALNSKNDELVEEVNDLKHQLKSANLQKRDSDMAREHYMTLLDMSLSKLRLFEEGVITARTKDRQFRSPTPDSGHISVSPETLGSKNLELALPMDGKKSHKSMGDSMSVTSIETLSDVSMSLTDTSRTTVDDKASSTSSSYSRLVQVSPVIPPRKNKKKKPFFTNPFMKKSASLDQPDISESADRLPPIKDIPAMERYTSSTMDLSSETSTDKEIYFSSTPCLSTSPRLPRTSSQPSLSLEQSELQVIPPALKRHHKKRSKSHDRLSDHENSRAMKTKTNEKDKTSSNDKPDGKSDKTLDRPPRDKGRAKSQERGREKSRDRGRDKSRDRGRDKIKEGKKPERQGSNKVKDKSKDWKEAKDPIDKNGDECDGQNGDKKVQRHASFGAPKAKKNGLVALAKDIEKRFKKKRRSKTADFAELFKNPEMLQKAKLEAGTLRSADTNDVDSYC